MFKKKTTMQWLGYIFEAETPETVCTYKPIGIFKTFFWVGMSFLMAMGINQLT